MTSVAIVLPVYNGAGLVERCLARLLPEAAAFDAEIIVVDDGSRDDTASRARKMGVRVIDAPRRAGPFAARNIAWRSTQADCIVFTDVRSRPRPGWLAALIEALSEPGVALAGGDTWVSRGQRLGERAAWREQPLLSRHSLDSEFLPWLPTANLATHRRALEVVDGFKVRRSGADVDFCWRVQLAGLGSLRFAAGAAIDWEPRASLLDTLSQFRRYGEDNRLLCETFVPAGYPFTGPRTLKQQWAQLVRPVLGELRRSPPRSWPEVLVVGACRLSFQLGYRIEPPADLLAEQTYDPSMLLDPVRDRLDIVDRLLADPPVVHVMDDAPQPTMGVWSTDRDCYEFLARHCPPAARTLETGTGLSTALFAAFGAEHVAVTPQAYEVENVLAYCKRKGIAADRVTYELGGSHEVLPRLEGELDLVFIDGGHGFPVPMIDWFYAAGRLRQHGLVVLDDVALPAVAALTQYLDSDPRWPLVHRTDKWAAYRRASSDPVAEDWYVQPFYAQRSVYPAALARDLRHRAGRFLRRIGLR
jgi:predicted O-methyltransferase YrrM